MLLHDQFLDLLRSELFVINSERFLNKQKTELLERGIGKHPLLKPEPIVVNDQLTGFKKVKKKLEALEEYPIFYDIEAYYEDEKWHTSYIDLYVEADVSIQPYLSESIYLAKKFKDVLVLERVFNASNQSEESIRIVSLINSAVELDVFEDDLDETPDTEALSFMFNFAPMPVLKHYLVGLLDFTYVLYGLVQEKKSLASLEAWLNEQTKNRRT